jgi:hypothetical protein
MWNCDNSKPADHPDPTLSLKACFVGPLHLL